jgi:Fe-S-cluster-containing hydrogenase component 2
MEINFPAVNPELCTGCGICIEVCPMEAIIMEDDKDLIVDDNCSNCWICKQFCMVEAIM